VTIEFGTDLSEVGVRLAAFSRRTFADFGLGGPDVALAGVGLSPEDFSWRVLEDYVEGRLTHEASRGDVFALLATALRNDIIDSLRKAAHMREENRSSLRRERDSADGAPSLDELPANASDVSIILEEEEYCRRVWASLAGDPDLEEMVRVILDLNLEKPRDIAAALGITTTEVQNRKKRLRRRFVEHHLVNEVHP